MELPVDHPESQQQLAQPSPLKSTNNNSGNKHQLQQQQPMQDVSAQQQISATLSDATKTPPTVYGELSILGYNGYIPKNERDGRRNKSKFLLCQRPQPNGIKKSLHYIVKQPQETKAIQDRDLYSISYTFSKAQAIIVEYESDSNTDMFQIGRSSEEPIDFVVLDTLTLSSVTPQSLPTASNSSRHHVHGSTKYDNNGNHHQQQTEHDLHGPTGSRSRYHPQHHQQQIQNLQHDENSAGAPANVQILDLITASNRLSRQSEESLRQQNLCGRPFHFRPTPHLNSYIQRHMPASTSYLQQHHPNQAKYPNQAVPAPIPSNNVMRGLRGGTSDVPSISNNNNISDNNDSNLNSSHNNHHHHHHQHQSSKSRSHAMQSTISRFACRIIVDRSPPYTARIYAAGFDSSKNIFLGEKATKWRENNSIDGLTTNGVLIKHKDCWREVSVDGGIYAIRESRSAAQKGTRIDNETNVLQDGTLIDLCGATLLWRSVEGFMASPTKKSLEEKIDLLNASRPQCPVGLNTLVIPRKPIPPGHLQLGNRHHHSSHHNHRRISAMGDSEIGLSKSDPNGKIGDQPYVYFKCGHVQGHHDWGQTEISNQRTCPICLSVGTYAKLSMGLEPSFYVDSGRLTHAFSPCGHMASEKTVEYWCSVKIPHGTHFFISICPFCATPLASDESPSTKLIFQDDVD